jgi:hypothetical protein
MIQFKLDQWEGEAHMIQAKVKACVLDLLRKFVNLIFSCVSCY